MGRGWAGKCVLVCEEGTQLEEDRILLLLFQDTGLLETKCERERTPKSALVHRGLNAKSARLNPACALLAICRRGGGRIDPQDLPWCYQHR